MFDSSSEAKDDEESTEKSESSLHADFGWLKSEGGESEGKLVVDLCRGNKDLRIAEVSRCS